MSSSMLEKLVSKHKDPAIKYLVKNTLALAKTSGVPQNVIDSVEKALELSWLRLQFEEDITTQASPTCSKITEETMNHDWSKVYAEGKTIHQYKPLMISDQVTGQFLKSILSAIKAKDVLEVGMFTGYTAIAMAEALPADGKVVTVDRDGYLKTLARSLIKDSPHKNKVEFVLGQAIQVLSQMVDDGKSFDAIFLDAMKSEYEAYLKICFEGNLLRPNGTVIVDNAFFGSKGYTDPESASAKFAQSIKNNPDLHVVMVPIKDGIFLIRRQKDVDGGVN